MEDYIKSIFSLLQFVGRCLRE